MKKDNLIIDNHGPLKNGSLKDLSELKVEELNQLKADGSAEWEFLEFILSHRYTLFKSLPKFCE